ncbi:MAG TPA: hypothetical protein VFU36_11475 [Jatrophihabitans sp.]|nr:hypothetical protein [Jatrophihabitans sp.]
MRTRDSVVRTSGSSVDPQDRVLWPTRVLAAAIIPFLLVAFCVLYPVPTDTRRLFAWQIKPTMTPMVLGAVYLGGAYFFFRAVRARRWHTVAGGFLPVGSFATLMGIATVLHWNKFLHGNVAFWLWAGLYFTTPVLVFGIFANNHREFRPANDTELQLPAKAAAVIAAAGGLSVATCALLFLSPATAIDIWPWQLTPLTARTLGAVFALGGAGLGVLLERRWSAVRIPLQVAGVMVALILLAGLRAHSEFDPDNPLTWLFLAGFGGAGLAGAVLYLTMQARANHAGAPARPR